MQLTPLFLQHAHNCLKFFFHLIQSEHETKYVLKGNDQ